MLVTVLPKLTNLKVFRCQMSSEALGPLLRILETNHPNLRGLAIAYVLFLSLPIPSHREFLQDNQLVASAISSTTFTQPLCVQW